MPLIFIGGAQRSGTTLLQTLLASSLGSPNLPEAHILSDILATYKRAKEVGNKTRIAYPTDDRLVSFFRAFAERHVADIAAACNAPEVLVLKDPNFVHVMSEVVEIFPQAVRVVCMRDPRDIVASFIQIGQRQDPTKPTKYAKRDILAIGNKTRMSYEPLMPAVPKGVAIIRYEDLVTDPPGSLKALGQDIGLELSLDRIEDAEWLEAEARHEQAWITELEGAKPSPASVGSFKRVLSGEEVAIVQKACRPIFEQFGYQLVENPAPGRRDKVRSFFGLKPSGTKKQ